jgi:hypothetical protein
MSVDTVTTNTTNTNDTTSSTSSTSVTTPWARAQALDLLAREGEWDTVTGFSYFFFDSHEQLWEVVSPKADRAEPFGPRRAARRVTEEWVRAERVDFDAWAAEASECDWCDTCGGGDRRQRDLEMLETLLGL